MVWLGENHEKYEKNMVLHGFACKLWDLKYALSPKFKVQMVG